MNKKFTILISVILFLVLWIFWLPGARVANDYHLPQHTSLVEQIMPWIWRETNVADGLGEYTGITLWSQPLQVVFGTLSALSVSASVQTKILGAMVFIIGFLALSELLQFLSIKGIGKYLGIFFYLTNSYFILLFDGGQISLALAYAISPHVVYLFLKMTEDYTFKGLIYLTFSLLAVSVLDIRFIYLLILIFFFNSIFQIVSRLNYGYKFIRSLLLSGIFVTVVLVAFHAYWILPSILIKAPQLPQTYERSSQINFLSFSSIGHSLLLQQPHWYKNVFGQVSNLKAEFIFIPVLVFMAPILRRRDKVVGFWLLITAVGIFLSKGSQEPFGQIYPWLFTHIPGFSLFRDPTKFFILVSLSYSILMAITIQEVSLLKKKYFNLAKLTPYLILVYSLWLLRPIYLGQMTGLLSPPTYEPEYSKIEKYFSQDNNYSRIFWIPTKAPLGYASNIHPPVEASRLVQKRPFAVGTKGSYETFNFLREAPYVGEIFDIAGIGYIVYPYLDPRRADMHPDNIRYYYIFQDQLSKRPWLSKVNNSDIPLYKVKEHQDRFFIAPNIWWVIGSDSIYSEATKSAKLRLSENSLIFAEEYPGLGNKLDQLPQAKIILNNKTTIDFAASFINSANLIFPAKNLNFEPDQSGWWKREAADLIRWRDFLQTKYGIDNQDFDLGGGWAVGEGSLELRIKNSELRKDKILLARVLESTRSGELDFKQGDQTIGKILTKKEGNNIKWFEVGQLIHKGELEITSKGDINVVNALAVLDYNQWENFKNKAEDLQNKNRIVEFNSKDTQKASASVSYKQINPTRYKVLISGLTGPGFLVFSQNYDGLWKLNGQTSLPVYSLLNGFKIDQDGEYIVEFSAQKYVYWGLIISLITLAAIITLCLKLSLKQPHSDNLR